MSLYPPRASQDASPHVNSSKVQYCLALTNYADDPGDWSWLFDSVIAAERAGFDKVVLSDHVVMGENLEAYAIPSTGGSQGGKQPTGPDGHYLEPLTTLSYLSARTDRIRLGTSILLAALRRPIVLAKTAATLDVLSEGRIDLGVGVGWQAEEYEAAGLSFAGRGRLLDETLEICQLLWTQPAATFDGATAAFERIHQMPKPRQADGVPIWVSGTVNRAVTRRIARFGTGWIPWGQDAADLGNSIPRMREGVAAHCRDPLEVGVAGRISRHTFASGEAMRAAVQEQISWGVTEIRVPAVIPPGLDAASDYLSALMSKLRP